MKELPRADVITPKPHDLLAVLVSTYRIPKPEAFAPLRVVASLGLYEATALPLNNPALDAKHAHAPPSKYLHAGLAPGVPGRKRLS